MNNREARHSRDAAIQGQLFALSGIKYGRFAIVVDQKGRRQRNVVDGKRGGLALVRWNEAHFVGALFHLSRSSASIRWQQEQGQSNKSKVRAAGDFAGSVLLKLSRGTFAFGRPNSSKQKVKEQIAASHLDCRLAKVEKCCHHGDGTCIDKVSSIV